MGVWAVTDLVLRVFDFHERITGCRPYCLAYLLVKGKPFNMPQLMGPTIIAVLVAASVYDENPRIPLAPLNLPYLRPMPRRCCSMQSTSSV